MYPQARRSPRIRDVTPPKDRQLQTEDTETAEALKGWFQAGDFAKNPIGVTFDPEKRIGRFEAGDPIEELLKRGSAWR